ncbi:hypothetical protein [Actinomadura sp. SCN-SB]|uniref:hypothetical protein n=1 Tax=Actinomadura sp. SCN-SB TaxID=3373092 RepID=UPI0037506E17
MSTTQPQHATATRSRPPFETPLLVSAARCTLRYVALPFGFPLLGIAPGATLDVVTGAALGVLLTLDVIAAVSIVVTLRRLWRVQHPRRWQYVPVAATLLMLVGYFLLSDLPAPLV